MSPKIPVSACCGAYVTRHYVGQFDHGECNACHRPCTIKEVPKPIQETEGRWEAVTEWNGDGTPDTPEKENARWTRIMKNAMDGLPPCFRETPDTPEKCEACGSTVDPKEHCCFRELQHSYRQFYSKQEVDEMIEAILDFLHDHIMSSQKGMSYSVTRSAWGKLVKRFLPKKP